MADPVEGVGGGIGLDVAAEGLHEHADGDEAHHAEEALDAAPDVDDFGDGQGRAAAEEGGDDADGAEEAVAGEFRGDVGVEVGLGADDEHVDDGDNVESGIGLINGCIKQ